MTPLQADVLKTIGRTTGHSAQLCRCESVGGGCINESQKYVLEDGRLFFVKSNRPEFLVMFEQELSGLRALEIPKVLRVPKPVAHGLSTNGHHSFLILEWIESGRPGPRSSEEFGVGLATLHQQTTAAEFGFHADNFIGSTPQPNTWHTQWIDFWRQCRLGYQLQLALKHGYADSEFQRLGNRALDATESIIGQPEEPPTLIHGDLWSGNYLYDQSGNAVLVDPAAYYGRREAELAMTRLFGGFDSCFYEAYEEVWPLETGATERIAFYQLYHVLNHLNLFGPSYRSQCLTLLKRFA